MPCYHPLFARIEPIYSADGSKVVKQSVTIQKRKDVENLMREYGQRWLEDHFSTLPCGKCVGCRLDYSRAWADRLMIEAQEWQHNYFLTLTYNNVYAPCSKYYDNDANGEVTAEHNVLTLRKRDLTLFLKRLRKAVEQRYKDRGQDPSPVRFFAAGEYGDTTMRPHFHLIVFNLELDDLVPYKKSPQGDMYFHSNFVQRCWSYPLRNGGDQSFVYYGSKGQRNRAMYPIGDVIVGEVTWESCAYVARYCMKKLDGVDADFYQRFGLVPEYVVMSRRPGIGRAFYDRKTDELYDYAYFSVSTSRGGKRLRPPRYYDKLYAIRAPERMAEIKVSRIEAMKSNRQLLYAATDEYPELLPQQAESLRESKIKILKARRNQV